MTMTTTDDESQEHREPKSIDDDLRRVLPMHLTSPPAGTEGAPGCCEAHPSTGRGVEPQERGGHSPSPLSSGPDLRDTSFIL